MENEILKLKADALARSGVTSGIIIALVKKGVLSVHEAREIYENVLLTLEQNQALVGGDDQKIFALARSMLEASLISLERPRSDAG